MAAFQNPFKPGAGHMPPYLAGREDEKKEFARLLGQKTILENLVLTGLRGTGKTVLLETFKPMAQQAKWLWVGTDLSESASLNEGSIATRLLTDLSVVTSGVKVGEFQVSEGIGFSRTESMVSQTLNFQTLQSIYESTPGLVEDKVKRVLEIVWSAIAGLGVSGIIFAYDEAQNLSDHAQKDQFPLSMLLDVFQSIQRKGIPFMLALTGLPTLFPKLVEARTYAERMFRVVMLDKLSESAVQDAIRIPLQECPVKLSDPSMRQIGQLSGGYPYFVQFICREVYDVFIQQMDNDEQIGVPADEILRKLDSDFFVGRWARATDRQRELLGVIAELEHCDGEFSVQDVTVKSKEMLEKPFSSSHVNQMLSSLADSGLIYKNRHGKYSFAVPLLGQFIRRQKEYM
ncbi:ATP-binding protein [Pseudomonas sp. B21-036]|uniref:ATP-binding protein n=1 Tax=Pseudomonas TaxID=286 RepID=UPI001F36351E|nr:MULTISPECIES: ATP-binding protein [Pseudomonas]UVL50508.1 ATP-binding protein [Pseudomonas sp. B21-036]